VASAESPADSHNPTAQPGVGGEGNEREGGRRASTGGEKMREKGARKRGRDQNCVREGVRECRVGMQRALLAARLMTQIVARSLARALSINQGAAGLAVNVCMCVCVCVCVRARARPLNQSGSCWDQG